ncbi:MAG: 16S rRNA (guanine(527)-N(7))-methyltransferase RsmG [Alphaproteobacteria bacterium]|nr:16S rRNA (guanine(527)-N(7))-methyltransferase RsmG [Alphaproteobacteria bacterium]
MDQCPELEAFFADTVVPYETKRNLFRYRDLLVEWNDRINLVAKSTLPDIATRHFLDSAQLMSYIPETALSLADMGAGAGFPGLVLAILAKGQGRKLKVYAIESIGKKADFLQAVVDDLGLNVEVRRERVENIHDLKTDVIAARALKALPDLLKYANGLMKKGSFCLFLKGKSLTEELTEAQKYWTFDQEIHQSRSDDSGQILIVKNLRRGRSTHR